MIKSAVTVSLVEESRGGPFVFWNGLDDAFKHASDLGFDAIEIFAPGPRDVDRGQLRSLVEKYNLPVAAVGTGAGMLKHGLSLTDPTSTQREAAFEFIREMIDFGAEFSAPAIIGSMQGRWTSDFSRESALTTLADYLHKLGNYAQEKFSLPLLYEPLNRYETNLLKQIGESVEFLESHSLANVKLLADLFHMNIEESDLPKAIVAGGQHIGHVHFVDSNRQAAGLGHSNFEAIAEAIKSIDYQGYLSAEAFPLPDERTAAAKTIESFKAFFRR